MTELPDTAVLADHVLDKDHNESGSDVVATAVVENIQSKPDKSPSQNNVSEDDKGHGEEQTNSWGGWVELENHPMIFSALLREWGAPNIAVQEVLELEGLLDAKAESLYGLILLSRWAPSATENELTEAPESVWFANQVQAFSCATVALMNIIMNHPELDLGDELNTFRSLTQPLDPLERGWKLDRNDKIRDIHNSFGTDIDKAKADHKLHQDFKEATGKDKERGGKGRKKKKKKKKKKRKKTKSTDEEEENGFHFTAYVPVAGAVWKMDGMERLPRKLGEISAGQTWISPVFEEVLNMRERAEVNQFEVSLLSLVQRDDGDSAGVGAEVEQMQEAREDWGPLFATLLKLHSQRGDLQEIMGSN